MIKVGINGFGRIGRMVFRAAVENFSKDIQIVGINDLLDPDYLAYMLKYDSVHGEFKGEVKIEGNFMTVNGNKIRLTAEKDPANLKWNEVGADVVVESTGFFLDDATARKHITAGAKKVVLSAPSKDDTPMFVYGVNHKEYKGQDIISNASCTTNCLAPLAKVPPGQLRDREGTDDHRARRYRYPEDRRRSVHEGLARWTRYPREHHPVLDRCCEGRGKGSPRP